MAGLSLLQVLCSHLQLLWVHECRRHCFVLVLPDLWLLQSFCLLLCNESWVIGVSLMMPVSNLLLHIPQLLFLCPWTCCDVLITSLYCTNKCLWWGLKVVLNFRQKEYEFRGQFANISILENSSHRFISIYCLWAPQPPKSFWKVKRHINNLSYIWSILEIFLVLKICGDSESVLILENNKIVTIKGHKSVEEEWEGG